MNGCLWLAVVTGVCVPAVWGVDWKTLRLQGFVGDFANVVNGDTTKRLEEYCGDLKRATGVHVALVTVASLEGEPVRDVAGTMLRGGLESGRLPEATVLLLFAPAEHRHWLEAGPAARAMASREVSAKIDREMRLALRRRDYSEALEAAAETLGSAAAAARGVNWNRKLARSLRPSAVDSIPWAMLAGAVLIVIWLLRRGRPAGYGKTAGPGLLPGLVAGDSMERSTWGSRGTGGFGGYDSGDGSGGFGATACNDW